MHELLRAIVKVNVEYLRSGYDLQQHYSTMRDVFDDEFSFYRNHGHEYMTSGSPAFTVYVSLSISF